MSPFSTFHSWGISSSFVFASTRPNRVKRSSSGAVSAPPPATWTIFLNSSMPNSRPPYPTRRQRKNAGPRLSSLIATATTAISGNRNSRSNDAATTSRPRLARRPSARTTSPRQSSVVAPASPTSAGGRSNRRKLSLLPPDAPPYALLANSELIGYSTKPEVRQGFRQISQDQQRFSVGLVARL